MDPRALLRQIERSYVAGILKKPGLLTSGPFVISLNPGSKLKWLNNASLRDECHPVNAADVRAMVRVFEEHDRMPRMELFRELHTEFIGLLISEGFEIESEMPVMVCT